MEMLLRFYRICYLFYYYLQFIQLYLNIYIWMSKDIKM